MKLKYIFFLSAALSLTGCNDGFLDRGPQDLNDKTFWNTVKDLETYANAFYGILPDGVTNLGDENSDNQIPFKPNSFLWGQYTVPAEDGEWSKDNWRNIRNINYFMTHYQSATGSEKEINQYVAEVRFFRALEYFNKIKTFGDVPWLDKDLDVDSGELFGKKNAQKPGGAENHRRLEVCDRESSGKGQGSSEPVECRHCQASVGASVPQRGNVLQISYGTGICG